MTEPARAAPRPRAVVFALALLASCAATITTAHTGEEGAFATTHLVTVFDGRTPDGPVAWFMVDGGDKPNPTINIYAGEPVVLILVNAGGQDHRLAVGAPIHNETEVVPPGNEAGLHVDVPQNLTGTITYHDPDWAERGAIGRMRIVTDDVPQDESSPALPLGATMLAVLAASALIRARRS